MINPEIIEPSSLPHLSLVQRKDLPEVSAIYFVIDSQGIIQYIGQSTNLKQRWQRHHRFSQLEELSVRSVIAPIDSTHDYLTTGTILERK